MSRIFSSFKEEMFVFWEAKEGGVTLQYSLSSHRAFTFLCSTMAALLVSESLYLICLLKVFISTILMDPPLQIPSLCLDSRYVVLAAPETHPGLQ